jgi:hypothetical protein
MAYLKKVTSATSDTGIGSGWFKIAQDGYDTSSTKWATEKLVRLVLLSGFPTGSAGWFG